MKNRLQKILEREHQGKDNAIVSRALEERLQDVFGWRESAPVTAVP